MSDHGPLELWGGFECTLARLGSAFRDQLDDTGHRGRYDDLDRVRALGIGTLRYPALWEAISPDALARFARERRDGPQAEKRAAAE